MAMKSIPKGEEITDNICKHIDKNYLNSLDIIGSGVVTLTIDRIEKHAKLTFNNGNTKENAILCYFKETPKPLQLCKTNIVGIIQALGSAKASDWKGKKIKLAVKQVKAFGELKNAVRVVA